MRLIDRVPPVALLLVGIVSVQIGSALATSLIAEIGAGGAVSLRVGLAAVALFALTRPRLQGHSAAGWRLIVGYGLSLGLMNFFFYEAIGRLPIGVAVTIEFLGPLGVAAITSRRSRDVAAVVAAGAGVALMALMAGGAAPAGHAAAPGGHTGDGLDLLGVIFALAAALCWGLYIPIAARTGAEFPQLEGLALAMVVSTAVVLPFGVASVPGWTWHVLGAGAVLALMSSLIPYSVELVALRRLRQSTFGVLCSLEPVVAAASGWALLGQRLSAVQLLGMMLVILASIAVLGGEHPEAAAGGEGLVAAD